MPANHGRGAASLAPLDDSLTIPAHRKTGPFPLPSAPQTRPVAIAPGPSKTPDQNGARRTSPAAPVMSYACQSCVRRKVKCDRISPICSSCGKTKLECVYKAPPPPRPRRRKHSIGEDDAGDDDDSHVRSRLVLYERLLRENGLFPGQKPASSATPTTSTTQVQPMSNTGHGSAIGHGGTSANIATASSSLQASQASGDKGNSYDQGKLRESVIARLISHDGKSRFISSRLWLDAGENDLQELSDHAQAVDEASQSASNELTPLSQDPLSAVMLGTSQNLLLYHPSHQVAMKLWKIHIDRIEPLCKVLHIPTTGQLVERISHQPVTATRTQECLLISIYHAAIFTMSEEECLLEFGQPRYALLTFYQSAVRHALVNASWLKTTDMDVIQAYVLFLITTRHTIDPHTYWILTGVAVRIAQRMGLHRDGENLDLSPFDVELRRRLFWQLIPLDAFAGQISGSGISMASSSWTTKQPLNINDDQIWPGMVDTPEPQTGATEMMFCLARAELSNLYSRTGVRVRDGGPAVDLRESEELNQLIDEVEATIESKYLRYCDIGNPLHFLALGVVRSAANVVRLRNRITALTAGQVIIDAELRTMCALAVKILDTDSAIYRNPNTKRFHWHVKDSFLWDALKTILTCLARTGFCSRAELDANWAKMADFYANHQDFIEAKNAIKASVRKATLHAFRVNPPSGVAQGDQEPDFILALRAEAARVQAMKQARESQVRTPDARLGAVGGGSGALGVGLEAVNSLDPIFGANMDFDFDFSTEIDNWLFWDQSALAQRQDPGGGMG